MNINRILFACLAMIFSGLLLTACRHSGPTIVSGSTQVNTANTGSTSASDLVYNPSATNLPMRDLFQTNRPAQTSTNVIPLAIHIATNASPNYISNIIAATSLTDLYKSYEKGLISKSVMMQAMLMAQNKQPLDFYGKVVDQNGDSVVDAKVQGNVGLNVSFVESKDEVYFTETDSQGRFKFLGLHGTGLGIWPKKEGYLYNLRQPSKRPGDYQPDPNHPVVFTMWKLNGPEPMVHVKASSLVPCDDTLTQFDLLTGKKSATGDLKVQLKRDPVNIIRGKPFNWSATLEIPSGGLQPIEDPYPNEAPIEGYLPSISLNFPTNMVHWSNSLYKQFYFKSRNGEIYGRMTVLIQADFQPPPTYFSADIYANPAGSRNLEFDPAKQIH